MGCVRGAIALGTGSFGSSHSSHQTSRLSALVLACFAAVLSLALIATTPAVAKPKYAALVLDKYSGRVLFARNADAPRYPASLTKIMTLYIVFDELAQENIKLNTPWLVSKNAEGQAPSKLGLDAGDTITVEEAILALVTKSANDVAMVVAENIGGTQRKFAQKMTKRARELGMARTTFRNPHGLPDKRQVTTARDMATLAQRVMDDFPQYYAYFSTESFNFRGRIFNNHNNLLGDYEGTNGIKTGYTRASGFNLTASVIRDGKHLVGVVLGGKTPRARDDHMVDILDEAFGRVPRRGHMSIASAAPIPRMRPQQAAPQPVIAAAQSPTPSPVLASLQQPAATPVPTPAAASNNLPIDVAANLLADTAPVPTPALRQTTTLTPPTPQVPEQRRLAVASAPAADAKVFEDVTAWLVSPANARESEPGLTSTLGAGDYTPPTETNYASLAQPQPYTAAPVGAAWRIQIGAYADAAEAGRRIQAAMSRAPSVLKGKGPATVPVKTASRTLFRSRFTGFTGEDQARNACTTLIREGISCITVPPDDWYAPSAN